MADKNWKAFERRMCRDMGTEEFRSRVNVMARTVLPITSVFSSSCGGHSRDGCSLGLMESAELLNAKAGPACSC